jgi:serine/threonine protein kinase
MAVIYKARHRGLGRLVALKMILHSSRASPEVMARFRREAEAIARIHHPNVVQIYDVGEQDGQPFFAMELVPGGSLAQRLDGTPQDSRKAAALVQNLAQAVATAHEQGIVHRDLKPGNVLLAADGTPKVADFGVAKFLDQEENLTETGAIVGTVSYMAPEQAWGTSKMRTVSPAADVYSLGVILYELLTGRPPFRGETLQDTLEQVWSHEPVPPSRLQPKVPRDLETICLTCLHKEPRKRYATGQAMAEDLRRFLAGEPIRARPIGVLERGVKWVRRRPALAALLAVGVAACALLVIGRLHYEAEIVHALATANAQRQRADASLEQANAQRQRADSNFEQANAQRQRADKNSQEFVKLVVDFSQRLADGQASGSNRHDDPGD